MRPSIDFLLRVFFECVRAWGMRASYLGWIQPYAEFSGWIQPITWFWTSLVLNNAKFSRAKFSRISVAISEELHWLPVRKLTTWHTCSLTWVNSLNSYISSEMHEGFKFLFQVLLYVNVLHRHSLLGVTRIWGKSKPRSTTLKQISKMVWSWCCSSKWYPVNSWESPIRARCDSIESPTSTKPSSSSKAKVSNSSQSAQKVVPTEALWFVVWIWLVYND